MSYWKNRAKDYDNISWVKDISLIDLIIEYCEIEKKEKILEAGVGSGKILNRMLEKDDSIHVWGIDSCKEMLAKIKNSSINTKEEDLRKTSFQNNFFDKILIRQVLHHLVGETTKAVDEMYRILKPGGSLVICEGVPMNNSCYPDFSKIVMSREDRLVFLEEDLKRMLCKFKSIKGKTLVLRQQSILNWVDNINVPTKLRKHIIDLHLNASMDYKKSVDMKVTDGDIFVDMKFFIVKGTK